MSEQGGAGPVTAWEAIASRRDVREFADRPVADSDLEQILEAGRRSPSSRNTQPWDFVVVTDRQQLADLAKVATGGGGPAPPPVIIALIAPGGERRQRAQYDLGQVTMSIMLTAAELGIGSGHASVTDQDARAAGARLPRGQVLPVPDHAGLPTAGRWPRSATPPAARSPK